MSKLLEFFLGSILMTILAVALIVFSALHYILRLGGIADAGWPVITDKNGDARLTVPLPGCSDILFEVYASTPEGYRMTTKPRIGVNRDFWGGFETENVYFFGFISDR